MLYEVELRKAVVFSADELPLLLDIDGHVSKRPVVTRLLENLLEEKAREDVGYFLAVTSFKRIGRGIVLRAGSMAFNVEFNCRMFLPCKGEILEGVVCNICQLGAFLRCGPVKDAFLSVRLMRSYHYVGGDKPLFLSDDLAKIENNVVVRFQVFAVRWGDTKKEFMMLASIEGDSLGPVTLPGPDGLVC